MAASLGFPFTNAQWKELERQAMIYKYLMSSVPVPPHLLIPTAASLSPCMSHSFIMPSLIFLLLILSSPVVVSHQSVMSFDRQVKKKKKKFISLSETICVNFSS